MLGRPFLEGVLDLYHFRKKGVVDSTKITSVWDVLIINVSQCRVHVLCFASLIAYPSGFDLLVSALPMLISRFNGRLGGGSHSRFGRFGECNTAQNETFRENG